jgi:adenosine deaminase
MTAPDDTQVRDATRAARRRLLETMPKAELHLHLDGSLRIATAIELARTRGIEAPDDWFGMSEALVGEMPGISQAELLKRFDLPIALMQDAEALERIAAELVEDKAADNVRYAEIRWGPLLHVMGGLAARGRDRSRRPRRRARRDAHGHHGPPHLDGAPLTRSGAERRTGRDRGAVHRRRAHRMGPRRAGGRYPDPLLHGRSFEVARENGLRITIHAGEWGGAAQVRRALIVDPERIAHGPGAIEDAALCAELTARGVTLDMAPTSNWQGASVPSVAEHPIGPLYRMGVPVTLNTDDLTVSDLKLSEEYIKASEQIGLSLPDLWAIDRHALDAAFIDETTRDRLRAEFDLWASNVPELAGPGG